MTNVSDSVLIDIEDFLLEKYEQPQTNRILFQTVQQDVLENQTLEELIKTPSITFQDKLFEMIKEKKLDEVEIYKKANISRQLFSKIRSEKDYHPTKNTVFALAISMGLTIDETSELLDTAGYTFTSTSKTDLIIQYFMYRNNYNIFAINEVLDKYKLDII